MGNLADCYTNLDDFHEFPFGRDGEYTLRLGRYDLPAFEQHMERYDRRQRATGGRRGQGAADKAREAEVRKAIFEHLWGGGTGPGGKPVSDADFLAMLNTPSGLRDVVACCINSEAFFRETVEEASGNSEQLSEQS